MSMQETKRPNWALTLCVLLAFAGGLLIHWFRDFVASLVASDELCRMALLQTLQSVVPKLAFWCNFIETEEAKILTGIEVRVLVDLWIMVGSVVFVCLACVKPVRSYCGTKFPEFRMKAPPADLGYRGLRGFLARGMAGLFSELPPGVQRALRIAGQFGMLYGCVYWTFLGPVPYDIRQVSDTADFYARNWHAGFGVFFQSLTAMFGIPIIILLLMFTAFGYPEFMVIEEEDTKG